MDAGKVIGLVIGLFVAGALIPTAVVNISNTTLYAGAPEAVLTLVPILGIIVLAGLALMIYHGST